MNISKRLPPAPAIWLSALFALAIAAVLTVVLLPANPPPADAAAPQQTAASPDELEWRLTVAHESIVRPAAGEPQRNVTLRFQVSCRADASAAWQSPPDCGGWSTDPGQPSDRVWVELDPGWESPAADQAVKGRGADFGAVNLWGQPGGAARVIRDPQGVERAGTGGMGVVADRQTQPFGINVRAGGGGWKYIRFHIVTAGGTQAEAGVWLGPPAAPEPTPEPTAEPTPEPTPDPAPEPDTAPTVSDTSLLQGYTYPVGQSFAIILPAADAGSGNGGPYDYDVWHQGQGASFADGIGGITFDPATRTLSGIPQEPGLYPMSYVVHDGDGNRDPEDAFRHRDGLSIEVIASRQSGAAPPQGASGQSGASGTQGEAVLVPQNWDGVPSGLEPGQRFRLLVVAGILTSLLRIGDDLVANANVTTHNALAQDKVAENPVLAPYASHFKALVTTTGGTTAAANTDTLTRYAPGHPADAPDDRGVPIYWYNGAKLADDYVDFYDGGWDSNASKDHLGRPSSLLTPWTGSNASGVSTGSGQLGTTEVFAGYPFQQGNEISKDTYRDVPGPSLYALSPVFVVGRPDVVVVPHDWDGIPEGVAPGQRFRLLLVAHGFPHLAVPGRHSDNGVAANHNTSVGRKVGENPVLAPYADSFAALVTTLDSDAATNTNTLTRHAPGHPADAPDDRGVPIYWYNGEKLADDYVDFYDGGWDSNAPKDQTGNPYSGIARPWTGSGANGRSLGWGRLGQTYPFRGHPQTQGQEISQSNHSETHNFTPGSLYALSPVFISGGSPSLTVSAGDDQSVGEGGTVTLQGRFISGGRSGELYYAWQQTSGSRVDLSTPQSDSTTFTAPIDGLDGTFTLTFLLSVYDEAGNWGSDTVDVVVTAINHKPTVTSVTVSPEVPEEGDTVTLTATATDPEGQPLHYGWQGIGIGSNTVELSNADTASASFTAPTGLDADTTYRFRVTVTDRNIPVTYHTQVTVKSAKDVFLSVSPSSIREGDAPTTVTVTLTRRPEDAAEFLSVDVNLAGAGSTALGNDYSVHTSNARRTSFAARRTETVAIFTGFTPVDDTETEGDETVRVTGSAGSLTVGYAEITIVDNDERRLLLSPRRVDIVEGETGTFDVSLTAQPTGEVTVTRSGSNPEQVTAGEGANKRVVATLDPDSLTFTTANWNIPQTVTVSTTEDNVARIGLGRNISYNVGYYDVSGGGYGYHIANFVSLFIAEDDVPSVVTTEQSLRLSEGGTAASYGVSLGSQPRPGETVTVMLASSDTAVATVSPASLEFTEDNWDTPQTVTVTPVNDDLYNVAGRPGATITHRVSQTPALGRDSVGYDDAAYLALEVSVADDDVPPFIELRLTPDSVAEDAGETPITVTAAWPTGQPMPDQDVTVTLALEALSANEDDFTQPTGPVEITIAAGQASAEATLNFAPVNDDLYERDGETVIVFGSATLSDDTDFVFAVRPATLTITNDDPRPPFYFSFDLSSTIYVYTTGEYIHRLWLGYITNPPEGDENNVTYRVDPNSLPRGLYTHHHSTGRGLFLAGTPEEPQETTHLVYTAEIYGGEAAGGFDEVMRVPIRIEDPASDPAPWPRNPGDDIEGLDLYPQSHIGGMTHHGNTLYLVGRMGSRISACDPITRQCQTRTSLGGGWNGYDGAWGLWAEDATTLWVADLGAHRLNAYDVETWQITGGFVLAPENGDPRGIWSDGRTMWVVNHGGPNSRIFAYDLTSGAWLPGREFDLPSNHDEPEGAWGDGATMWITNDAADGKLLAYDLLSNPIGARLPGHDIALDSYINRNPAGIAADGETMWVANWEGYNSSRLFAYRMPESRAVGQDPPELITCAGVDFSAAPGETVTVQWTCTMPDGTSRVFETTGTVPLAASEPPGSE